MNVDERFDARSVERLVVRRADSIVGSLERTNRGATFTYAQDVVEHHRGEPSKAVAFAMPVRPEPYECSGVNLHPFFANLLPEGLRLAGLVRRVKTSEDDLFSLLAAAGEDTIGDVHVEVPGRPSASPPRVERIENVSFAALLEAHSDGVDPLTVAGVQAKFSDAMITLPVSMGRGGVGHLLKLDPPDHPRLVENEAWVMQLARDAGLLVARTRLLHDSGGTAALAVERFDRVRTRGRVQRLHQEDGCQLLDRYPADKYRISVNDLLEALEVCTSPPAERLRLLELHAFSYLVTNGDLHAKNVSVLVRDDVVRLAPAYDLIATRPYGDEHMAMRLDGRDQDLRRAHFLAIGERFGVRAKAIERALDRVVARVGPAASRVAEIGLDPRRTALLERTIEERCTQLAR